VEVPVVPDSLERASGVSAGKTGPDAKTPDSKRQPDSATPPVEHIAAATLPDAPKLLPKLVLPANVTAAQLEAAKKERESAIDKAHETTASVETVRQDSARRLDAAKAEQEKLQKSLESRRKALSPVIQQSTAVEVERKKLEEACVRRRGCKRSPKTPGDAGC
jgi:hypothetical protein